MNPAISPPTDNLYKFLAVFGLILLGGSFVYPSWQRKEYDQLKARFDGDAAKLQTEREVAAEFERDTIKLLHSRSGEWLALFDAQKKDPKKTVNVPADLLKEAHKLAQVHFDRKKVKEAIVLKQIEIDARRTELMMTRAFLSKLDYYSSFAGCIGFLACLIGFSRWLANQRTQDEIQQKELTVNDNVEPRPLPLIMPADVLPTMNDWGQKSLRRIGIWATCLGSVVMCFGHIRRAHAEYDLESAAVSSFDARTKSRLLLVRLFSKFMDNAELDDMQLADKGPGVVTTDREFMLKYADDYVKLDQEAAPLKGLMIERFAAEDRLDKLQSEIHRFRGIANWCYWIGGAIMAAGVLVLFCRPWIAKFIGEKRFSLFHP
ncbi:MAG TPA: hypothetical protein VHR66_32370 [Gemmataceae bacterium]|jgi:hypothetical protein|nr:hypothetical protein [Gemmataceae bacterium]